MLATPGDGSGRNITPSRFVGMGQLAPRTWFELASAGALAVLGSIPDDDWDKPGLGDWTVRELAAHTMRAWSTVVDYLDEPLPVGDLLEASTYFVKALAQPGVHEGVLERARTEAQELENPVTYARARAAAALGRVAEEPDDRLVPSRFGPLALSEYLKTRAFELTVHGLDLARATGVRVPEELATSVSPAAEVAVQIASVRRDDRAVLLALTGREPLPDHFSVLG